MYEPGRDTMVLVAEESYFTDMHDLIEVLRHRSGPTMGMTS